MTTRQSAKRIDKTDRKATHMLDARRRSWPVRLAGTISDVSDQPPMRLLCAATIVLGAVRRDRQLALAGARMLAAHTIATWGKNRIKNVVDRTRPDSEQDGYRVGLGDRHAHDETSFPSGHSAGAVAVAQAFARSYPKHAVAARVAAGVVSAAQVPRGKHFIGDVIAGALIGLVAEKATDVAAGQVFPTALREGHAPFTVASSPGAALRIPPAAAARPRS